MILANKMIYDRYNTYIIPNTIFHPTRKRKFFPVF